jgi:hypothetical protein
LCIYGVVKEYVSNYHLLAWSCSRLINNESERMWKEAILARFEILSRHLAREMRDLQIKKHVYYSLNCDDKYVLY